MTTEHELMGTINVSFECEMLGKLSQSKLKALVRNALEDFFDKDENICQHDIYEVELDLDYEVLE